MSFLSVARMMFNAISKPRQRISIPDIPPGKVLDIGGGGEGVIAQAGGSRVIALDKRLSEINEARGNSPAAAWLAADAAQLPYAQHSFDHATAFFSCMYMPVVVQNKVFKETYRALKPGGEFWVWDVSMSSKSDIFAISLQINLPSTRKINTAYGVKAKDQSADSLASQLQEAGFQTEVVNQQKHWFFIKARK